MQFFKYYLVYKLHEFLYERHSYNIYVFKP
jgi:hypothetical protein